MDDGGLRSTMVAVPDSVDTSNANMSAPNPPANEKPFALRSAVYTVGFLLMVLGIIPSLFHLAGMWPTSTEEAATVIRDFWSSFQRLLGVAIFAIGLAAYTFCSVWLIFHGRGPHVEFDPPKIFVATGPYRWVRNPVVITLIVTVFGEAVFLGSWGIFGLVIIGIGFAHYQVTRIEEPRLRDRFGDSYVEYCRRVPRWLPCPPRADSNP